jgi:hypothetical protein
LEGMAEYWGHTLASEEAGYRTVLESTYFRIDMLECPSKGLLIQIGQEEYHDYCQHCMGWIKPIMDEANFLIDHEHNHQGQCWWEMYPADDDNHPSPPPIRDDEDVRKRPGWQTDQHDLWLGSQQVES